MTNDIPPIDPDLDLKKSESHSRREQIEYDLLEAEFAIKQLAKKEIGQRYWIKWIAIGTGIVVILGMAGMFMHLVHSVFWGPFILGSPAFSVAMIVAPIASITSITVVLFVGAFRRFEDRDIEQVGNGVTGAASLLRGG